MLQMKQYVIAPTVAKPLGHYCHAVKWRNLIFVSGQGGFDEDGNLIGKNDPVAQVEQTYKNIDSILRAAGASFRDVVQLNTYYKSRRVRQKLTSTIKKLREKYMSDLHPAACGVVVKDFVVPNVLIEISAIAVIDEQ